MAKTVAAIEPGVDGKYRIEYWDGQVESLTVEEIRRRDIVVGFSNEMRGLLKRTEMAEARTKELEAVCAEYRDVIAVIGRYVCPVKCGSSEPTRMRLESDYALSGDTNFLRLIVDADGDVHLSLYEFFKESAGVRVATSGIRHSQLVYQALRELVDALGTERAAEY